jgi:hypothetical protein
MRLLAAYDRHHHAPVNRFDHDRGCLVGWACCSTVETAEQLARLIVSRRCGAG